MSDLTADAAVYPELPFPSVKLCECGCGQPTRIAKVNDRRYGHVKGQGVRFLKGHSHRGKVVSAETRARLSVALSGDKQGGWKGDDASYRALHGYICAHHPKTGTCEECGQAAERTQYALIHGRTYSRNRSDYRELCSPCHVRYDRGGKRLSADARAKVSVGMRANRDSRAQSKLTMVIATEIRRRHAAEGISHAALAREWGVGRQTVSDLLSGRTWMP